MPEKICSRLLVIAALVCAVPAPALAKADPCQGKVEGEGDGKGVVIGARGRVKVVVAEVSAPKKAAKFTLENSAGEPPMDLAAARKGMDWTYSGPVQLHVCAREFHAPESCWAKATYRPGVIELASRVGYRVKLKVTCK